MDVRHVAHGAPDSAVRSSLGWANEGQPLVSGNILRFRPNPETDMMRPRSRQWVRERGLTRSQTAFDWFCAWDLERLTGNTYSHARGDGLDLCAKGIVFAVIFDDQYEGRPVDSAAECAGHMREFLRVLHGHAPSASGSDSPLVVAFSEMWDEATARSSPAWIARARHNWEYTMSAVIHERVHRRRGGGPLPLDTFLELRRGAGYMPPFLDILEPGAGFECPPLAFHSPQMRKMRLIAIDLVNYLNDVGSLDKELARGEDDNLVITLQHEHRCTVGEAAGLAVGMMQDLARRFVVLRDELPDVCGALGLSDDETSAAFRYGDALEFWVGGFEPWQNHSPRYVESLQQRPAEVSWFCEDLLGSPAVDKN